MTRPIDSMTAAAFVRRSLLGLGAVGLALGMSACSDDPEEETPSDDCLVNTDCPAGQVCDLLSLTCVPDTSGGDTEVDAEPDVGTDTEPDTVEDTGEDTDEDPSTDPGEDTVADADTPDTPEVGPDTPEVGPDTPEVGPDVVEVGPDTPEVGPDTPDVPAGPNPWVAYIIGSTPPQLAVVQLDGTDNTILPIRDSVIRSPEWSPDGTRLAYAGFQAGDSQIHIRIIDFSTDEAPITITPDVQQVGSLAWSRDGSSFVIEGRATGAEGSALYSVDATTGATTQLTTPSGSDAGPVWAWGSNEIFFVRSVGDVFDIYTIPGAGGTPTQVTFSSGIFGAPAVNDDGSVIYYQSGSPPFLRRLPRGGSAVQIGQAQDVDADVIPGSTDLVIARLLSDAGLELFVVSGDNATEIRRLTFDADTNSSPDVSPVDSSELDITPFTGG